MTRMRQGSPQSMEGSTERIMLRTQQNEKNGAQQCQERIIEPSMMNNKKSFFQSLREGFILYAAANTCFPVDAELMKLYRQTINEEMN